METKICKTCGQHKQVEEFRLNSARGYYYRANLCLVCDREKQRLAIKMRRAAVALLRAKPAPLVMDDGAEARICKKCGGKKALTDFPIRNPKTGNRRHTCSECHRDYHTNHKQTWRGRNPEKVRAARLRRSKQSLRESSARWRRAHPERVEELRIKSLAHTREYAQKWRRANPEFCRERARRRRAVLLGVPLIEKIDGAFLIARDKSTCYLCSKVLPATEVTIDHVQAITRGGSHTMDNMRVACQPCNSRKHNKTLDEYYARFPHLPKAAPIPSVAEAKPTPTP